MNVEQNLQPHQDEPPPKPVPTPVPKTFLQYSNKPAKDFFDKHRDKKVCTIPATSRQKPDAFLAMRPKQGTCLDYRISELDTKFDAGMTRIHIRQVNATYEPLPPKELEVQPPPSLKKRTRFNNKYCHAGSPVYEFAEEIYARKVEKKQEFYKDILRKNVARHKCEKRVGKIKDHEIMLQLCGPDWFIELSPIQKESIDNLNDAIKHDLRFDDVKETSHILGKLGIFLRPNRKLLEIALKNCCKCPVELLLTLYQLMNPKRTFYSLNDMLILSAVVHLTIKSTLKEMHIRLPSPPPPLETIIIKPKQPKKVKYDSPYLQPCIYNSPKQTMFESWKKGYSTFPKSPYFSYLKDLNELRHPTNTTRSRLRMSREKICGAPENATLQNELLAAQSAFNKLHEYYDHENVKLLRASLYSHCNKRTMSAPDLVQGESNLIGKPIDETANQEMEETPTSMEQTTVTLAIDVKLTEEFDDQNNRTMAVYQCQVDTKVEIGEAPLTNDISDSNPTPDNVVTEQATEVNEEVVKEEEKLHITKTKSSENDCNTKTRLNDDDEDQGPLEIKKRTPSNCTCRQIIEKKIEDTTCQCEKCKEAIEKANIITTFVIADTKMNPDGSVPIIADVKAVRRCTCLQRYMKRVNKIDHQKEIRRFNEQLIDMGQPFIVNGVSIGPDGEPIYNLSAGVAVKSKCPCLKEELEIPDPSKLATIPMGRQKYAISGVHATPEGNVFVISSAIPIEPCRCMDMYKQYMETHNPCLQLYEAFMVKIKEDTEEHMRDLEARNITCDNGSSSSSSICNAEPESQPLVEEPVADAEFESSTPAVDKVSDHGSADHVYDKTCFTLDIDIEKINGPRGDKRVCMCKEEIPRVESINFEPNEYERYILLQNIPLELPAQLELIKNLLSKLAQDGYPLARLPDCHKLPIFKLWMAKRAYQYWTQEDRSINLATSKSFWNHVLHCRACAVKDITLGITNTVAANFTWFDAKLVKDYTSKRKFNYQRKQRQCSVAAAREFFSSLFLYENPTKRFFDVYFAYMPSKEEDVFYENVWQSHNFKNMIMARQHAKIYRCSKLV